LTWEPVPGALAYEIEVDYEAGVEPFSSQQPALRFDFVGAQPGRWRVWAILPDSKRSPVSEWRGFRYLR